MPNIKYALEERIWMFNQRKSGFSYRRVVELFSVEFPEREILNEKTVRNVMKKFEKSGNINPSLNRIKQPNRALSEEMKENIELSFIDDPTLSITKAAENLSISESSIQKVLKSEGYKAYKMRCHQSLNDGDYPRRTIFLNNATITARKCDISGEHFVYR